MSSPISRSIGRRVVGAVVAFSASGLLLAALTFGGRAEAEPSSAKPVKEAVAPKASAPSTKKKPHTPHAKIFLPVESYGGY